MKDGFLNILKPPGMTSFDCIRFLEKREKNQKFGHAGTLDLPACGVLVVAQGRATKFLPYLPSDKEYIFRVYFGMETDTGDLFGRIIQEKKMEVGEKELQEILTKVTLMKTQRIPPYSARHFQGKRLYQLAAKEEAPSDLTSPVEIYKLELKRLEKGRFPQACLYLHCSRGTYVRGMAKTIGEMLGGVACAHFIVRIRVGPFLLEESQTLEEIQERPSFFSIERTLSHLPALSLPDRFLSPFMNGATLSLETKFPPGSLFRALDRRGNFLGLGRKINGTSLVKGEKILK